MKTYSRFLRRAGTGLLAGCVAVSLMAAPVYADSGDSNQDKMLGVIQGIESMFFNDDGTPSAQTTLDEISNVVGAISKFFDFSSSTNKVEVGAVHVTMSPGTMTDGTRLKDYSFSTSTTGVKKSIASSWYHSSGWASASEQVRSGDSYYALCELTAEDGYKFSSSTKVSYGGKDVTLVITNDGKTAIFSTPSIEIAHKHAPAKDQGGEVLYYFYNNSQGHSPKCAICGELYEPSGHSYKWESRSSIHWQECTVCHSTSNKGSHDWKQTEVSGVVQTYTCTTCSATKQTYDSEQLIGNIKLESVAPLMAGDSLPDIKVSNYKGAHVTNVSWSKDGSPVAKTATIEAGATYTFTVTVGCEKGCSLIPADHPNHTYSQLDMDWVDKVGVGTGVVDHKANTITRTFSYTAKSKASVEATLPKTPALGMKLKDLTDSASVKVNGKDYAAGYAIYVTTRTGDMYLYGEQGTLAARTEWDAERIVILGSGYAPNYQLAPGDSIVLYVSADHKSSGMARSSDSATINKNGWTVEGDVYDTPSENLFMAAEYRLSTEDKSIKQINLQLKAPVLGAVPAASATVPSGAKYKAGKVTWSNTSKVFAVNTTYGAVIELTATDGYTFPEDAGAIVVSINGYIGVAKRVCGFLKRQGSRLYVGR